ncbi:MAG: AsmA family protein [Aeromonas sp.]
MAKIAQRWRAVTAHLTGKKVLIGAAAVMALGLTLRAALPSAEQFKPLLAAQLSQQLGREVQLNGAVSWQFWPRLGLQLSDAAVRNPAGFSEPDLLRVGNAHASVAVRPLFSQRLEIGDIELSRAHLFIERRADGEHNLAALGPQDTSAPSTPAAANPPTPARQNDSENDSAWQLTFAGIHLSNASAHLRDEMQQSRLQLTALDLHIDQLVQQQWSQLNFSVRGEQRIGANARQFSLHGQTRLKLAPNLAGMALDDLRLSGDYHETGLDLSELALQLNHFSLDQLQPSQLSLRAKARTSAPFSPLRAELSASSALLWAPNQQQLRLNPLSLTGSLSHTALAPTPLPVTLKTNLTLDLARQQLALSAFSAQLDKLAVHGEWTLALAPRLRLNARLGSEQLDITPWLTRQPAATPKAGVTAQPNAAATQARAAQEPDLSALTALDARVQWAVGTLQVGSLALRETALDVELNDGHLTLHQGKTALAGALEGGQLRLSGELDSQARPARYALHGQVQALQLAPLLRDLAGVDKFSGLGTVQLDLRGQSLLPAQALATLNGHVQIALKNGALSGLDLGQQLRRARAFLHGESVAEEASSRATDFAAMSATFILANGRATSQNIALEAPALRVQGEGEANLLTEQLDFLLRASVVESSKGQGGRRANELSNLTLPLRVSGPWQTPRYQLQVKDLLRANQARLQEKLRQEATRGLNQLLGTQGEQPLKGLADGLLNGLFKR